MIRHELIRVATFLLAGVLLAPIAARAGTDLTKFERLLKKTTIDSLVVLDDIKEFQKAKVACVCQSPAKRAGVLVRLRMGFPPSGYLIACNYPTFSADGSVSSLTACDDWELLTK